MVLTSEAKFCMASERMPYVLSMLQSANDTGGVIADQIIIDNGSYNHLHDIVYLWYLSEE